MTVVAEVVRSGFVESRHHGTVVGLAADGTMAFSVGDPAAPVYPRSSNKPAQAVAMLRCGLRLAPRLLAVVCASHSGHAAHLAAVREILAGAGLGPADLQNTPDWALDQEAALAMVRAGQAPAPLTQNCSGKHAGMLATCVCNGWPQTSYCDPQHPLQRSIAAVIAELAGEPIVHVGVDGCGAPAHAISLAGLAQSMRAVATAPAGTPERAVADAMRAHPDMVGGPGRDVTALMRAVPGLVAKDGAEAVYAMALPDGRALALKIDDGGGRARVPVALAALARLGVESAALGAVPLVPVLGHGQPVGEVRAVW